MRVSKWGVFIWVTFSALFCLAASSIGQTKKQLRGKVEISVADDFKNKKAVTQFFLKDKVTGKRTELKFAKGKLPLWIAPAQEIVVSGTTDSSGSLSTDSAALVTDTTIASTTSAKVVKSTLVIMAEMDGGTGLITRRDAEAAMFGSSNSVRDLFLKNSFGKLDFLPDSDGDGKSDIYGPVRLTAPLNAGCNYSQWIDEAVKLAQQSYGVNPSNYTYKMVILPANIPCFWNGLAVIDTALVKGYDGANTTFVMAHELGHLMGMGHAAIDYNNDGQVDSEYGDSSCDLGNDVPDLRFVNGPHAFQQGFYADTPGKVVTVTSNQSIEIWPLEVSPSNAAGAQIVRVPRVGTSEYYYLTLRNASSYAKSLPAIFSEGLSIHRAGATPYYSYFVQTLNAGQSWQDLSGGVRLTATKKNSGSIVVSIEITESGCITRAPTFTLNSSVLSSNKSSGTVNVGMNIVNNDSLSCAPTQFTLGGSFPAGVTSSYNGYKLNLAPGAKSFIYFELSFSNLVSGNYPIQLKLSDLDGVAPLHSESLIATSLLIDTNPPSIPQGLSVVAGTRGRAELSWGASVDNEGANVCYSIYRDSGYGPNQVGSVCDTKLIDYPSTTSSYFVRAMDSAGNQSGNSNQVIFSKTKGKR